mmetsp:Transcript_4960/g.8504  ORF Transcript_4960/g.8504 Transcript_4960/m.8504 type:complete len:214 (-) Transcript_4960:443-1084(-)
MGVHSTWWVDRLLGPGTETASAVLGWLRGQRGRWCVCGEGRGLCCRWASEGVVAEVERGCVGCARHARDRETWRGRVVDVKGNGRLGFRLPIEEKLLGRCTRGRLMAAKRAGGCGGAGLQVREAETWLWLRRGRGVVERSRETLPKQKLMGASASGFTRRRNRRSGCTGSASLDLTVRRRRWRSPGRRCARCPCLTPPRHPDATCAPACGTPS